MTEFDSITPPPELLAQWIADQNKWTDFDRVLAIRAAGWGADQELEACCEWFASKFGTEVTADLADLRAARRPSLKAQAQQALDQFDAWLTQRQIR